MASAGRGGSDGKGRMREKERGMKERGDDTKRRKSRNERED